MANENLSSIPLPSEADVEHKSKSSIKKSAKDLLKEALKDHHDSQDKSVSALEKTTQQTNQDDGASSQNIVDMLFKNFITRKIRPGIGSISKKSIVDHKKVSSKSTPKTSVSEISQFLDKEILSIKSTVTPVGTSEIGVNPKLLSVSELSYEEGKSGSEMSIKPTATDSALLSECDNPILEQSIPLPVPVSEANGSCQKTGSVSETNVLENSNLSIDKPIGKTLTMLPLPLAKKSIKSKMVLDLKLSKESLSLIKENDQNNAQDSQCEEGEVVSSHSGESEKNEEESDSDSDGIPSETGSIDSSTDEKKKHSSKHKKKHKHKHKKKKKKKKSKSKDKRDKGEKKKDKQLKTSDKSDPLVKITHSELKITVSNDQKEEEKELRKRKSSFAPENDWAELKSHYENKFDKSHKKHKSEENDSKDDYRDKKKRKKSRSRSRSRSRSPKRSKHSSSSYSKSRSKDKDEYDDWDASKYGEDSRKSKSHHKDREKHRSKDKSDEDLRLRIDKAKLRRIAIANALKNMKSGEGPEVSITTRAGGKSVEELTDFCKKIAEKDKDRDSEFSDSEEDQAEENEEESFIHHPFKLKDTSKDIVLNIRNAKQLPVLTPSEKQAQQATLRTTFPVSSGSHHRAEEWIPVEPKPPPPAPSSAWPMNEEDMKPPPPPPSIFEKPEDKKIDIGSIISERLQAVRKLQQNPYDIEALGKMHKAQERANKWASSKHLPGQYVGSTGAQVLSQQELIGNKRHQAWAKKGQFHSAAPVNGGIGMFLLQKMGWKQGEGLGKNNEGNKEPLMLDVKMDRKGLHTATETQKGKAPQPQQQPRAKDLSNKHPVSGLMELCKKRKWPPPDFQVVNESGPDHKKNFLFRVKVNNVEYQPAVASSNKKTAKAQCAAVCLQEMGLLPRDAPLNI